MESQVVLLREAEQTDQVDRVALEEIGRREIDAVVVDDEVVVVRNPPNLRTPRPQHHAAENRCRLGLLILELRA